MDHPTGWRARHSHVMSAEDSVGLNVTELNHLYEKLSAEERDELLQCLLIAAPRGGEAMIKVLEDLLLCHAHEEFLGEQFQRRQERGL